MAYKKTKIFTIIFGIQCFILLIQIVSITSAPQSNGYQNIRPARRQKNQNYVYGATRPQQQTNRRSDKTKENKLSNRPNSYYTRLLTTSDTSAEDRRIASRLKYEQDMKEREKTLHHHHHNENNNGGWFGDWFGGSGSSGGGLFGNHHQNGLFGNRDSYNRRRRPYYSAATNPCYYRSRQVDNNREQGRIFWDLHYHSHGHGGGGGGYGDSGVSEQYDDCNELGSGLYSDSGPVRRPQQPQSYLALLANGGHGIRQKPIRRYRPSYRPPRPPYTGGGSSGISDNDGNSDVYDPVYDDRPVNEGQLDENENTGPALSPGQLVGGVAHTVNGIIQTLTGNG